MTQRTLARRRPVQMARRVPVPRDVVQDLLEVAPHRVWGGELSAPWTDGEGRGELDSGVRSGPHVRRGVRMGWGPLLEEDGVVSLPLWWEDAEHPQLFPTFDGGVELRGDGEGTELRLAGSYRPPLGPFGRFADSLVGHRVVKASLEAFLAAAEERLVAAAGEAMAVGAGRQSRRG